MAPNPQRAMNLLRIHDQILNMDQVQMVYLRDTELTLYVTGRQMLFRGEDATLLRQWLLNNARDLVVTPSTQALDPGVAPVRYASGDGANTSVQLFKVPLP